MFTCRGAFVVGLVVGLAGARGALAADTWREVRSPHFRVVTDGSSKEGRAVANEFEQMRHVFVVRFKNEDVETGAPLTVVALRDDANLQRLGPRFWKDRDRVAGLFFTGWERQFALIRLDSFGDQNQAVVFHEYTHAVMHANLHWLPTWLDEGLAEFYAYTRFQDDRIYVGAPSVRMAHLRQDLTIPVQQMLQANGGTYARDPRREDLFYGEAWAMVHYMMFAKETGQGVELQQFLQLIEAGTEQGKAFLQAFGDFKKFDAGFNQYLTHFSLVAAVLPPEKGLNAKDFEEHVLTAAEVDYRLGCFTAGAREPSIARALLEEATSREPELAGPHEELGFSDFEQGRDEDAVGEWRKAVALDPKLYRSAFALVMSGTPFPQQSAAELGRTQLALQHVTELEPRFAPAYIELAILEMQIGLLQRAYQDAQHGERLAPWRAGYHLLVGQILMIGHQPAAAAKYARLVASRWPGADHNEAVDLWQRLPPAARGEGPDLSLDLPAGAKVVRGTIVSTTCGEGKSGSFRVQVQPDAATPGGPPLTFIAAEPYESGFSDTLWFGSDHFSSCHHLAGLQTLIAYKPGGAGDGILTAFEIRQPAPHVADTRAAVAGATAQAGAAPQP